MCFCGLEDCLLKKNVAIQCIVGACKNHPGAVNKNSRQCNRKIYGDFEMMSEGFVTLMDLFFQVKLSEMGQHRSFRL